MAASDSGYWLAKKQDGSVGLVTTTPIVNVGGITKSYYLGTDISAIGPQLGTAVKAIGGATGVQVATLMQSLDVGDFALKRTASVWVPKNQKPGQTNPGKGQSPSGSSAVFSPIVPEGPASGALDAIGGLFGGLSSWEDLALRVLQALAGFALLLLGLQALTGTGGQGMPLRTIRRFT